VTNFIFITNLLSQKLIFVVVEECAFDACNISSNGGVNPKETKGGTKGTSLVNLFVEAI